MHLSPHAGMRLSIRRSGWSHASLKRAGTRPLSVSPTLRSAQRFWTAKLQADPPIDQAQLMTLAHDLPATWNAPGTDMRTKQRLTRILIQEVVIDLDDITNEAVATVHWTGGRHTELRVARVNVGRYPSSQHFSAVEVMRKLGGQWPDRELAVTMNRMRCKSPDGKTWTTVRVTELRERLGIAPFDPMASHAETISVEEPHDDWESTGARFTA